MGGVRLLVRFGYVVVRHLVDHVRQRLHIVLCPGVRDAVFAFAGEGGDVQGRIMAVIAVDGRCFPVKGGGRLFPAFCKGGCALRGKFLSAWSGQEPGPVSGVRLLSFAPLLRERRFSGVPG